LNKEEKSGREIFDNLIYIYSDIEERESKDASSEKII